MKLHRHMSCSSSFLFLFYADGTNKRLGINGVGVMLADNHG
jgi:hypothetical protein